MMVRPAWRWASRGGDGGAAGRVRCRFDTEERGGEIAATGHDRHVHGEVVTAELPGPFLWELYRKLTICANRPLAAAPDVD